MRGVLQRVRAHLAIAKRKNKMKAEFELTIIT